MKHQLNIYPNLLLLVVLTIAATMAVGCAEDEHAAVADGNPLPLKELLPVVEGATPSTRATAADEDYVGRSQFDAGEQLTMTTIRRTEHALQDFSYTNMTWSLNEGWVSDSNKDIYWSDATSDHTFVGYSLPPRTKGKPFLWKVIEGNPDIYYGCLGTPADGILDFSSNDLLKQADLLLTYARDVKAEEGGIKVTIPFHHALSQVRVEIIIGDFSAGVQSLDNLISIHDLIVKNQPIGYKWKENVPDYSYQVFPWEDADSENLSETSLSWDAVCDVKPWIRQTDGIGSGANRHFDYRMLAVPGTRTGMEFDFKVTYPNPLNFDETAETHEMKTDTYHAKLVGELKLYAGKVTVIKIRLNHRDDQPTVGAEYVDWVFTPTPDRGELTKNETFLASVDRNSVKLSGEDGVTVDDATWLFKDDGTDLMDRLGNKGTISDPYKITTAAQLLAFAYEVNEGMDFTGKYVRLDASLVLQPFDTYMNAEATRLEWPGIGTEDKPFKGVFFGGQGSLSHLYGKPLFGHVGPTGWLEQVTLTDVLGITGGGGILADVNEGLFCACRAEGDMTSTSEKVGGLVGENSGNIVLCVHLGDVTGASQVGGLAGINSGYIATSLQAGAVTATATPSEGTTVTTAGITHNTGDNAKTVSCYYDSTLCPTVTSSSDSEGKPTTAMQSKAFVDDLNYVITSGGNGEFSNLLNEKIREAYSKHGDYGQNHQFSYSPLQYPRIVNTTNSTQTGGE